jgi:N-acetyltransferase
MPLQLPLPVYPLSLTPTTLTGRATRLEPLAPHHARGLFEAATHEVFRFLYLQPDPWSPEGFDAYVSTLTSDPNRVPLAIIHQPTSTVIGSSSYLAIRPKDHAAEIGTTWFNTAHWGTSVNPEIKFLMLRHAFETLNCQRICLRVDTRNTRSMSAVRKLGAHLDGVMRRSSIDRFGVCRDMAEFSIIPEEWPTIRAKLLDRLGYQL